MFTPTGETLTDQANVPDAVVTNDGTLFVYYIGQGISENDEDVAVAISEDDGNTWTYHTPTFADLPNDKIPGDPDVVLLGDGTFRMFYTCDFGPGSLGICYAESDDGLHFAYKGIALHPTTNVIDSTTFLLDDTWMMLVLDEKEPKQYIATSTDGKTFTLQGEAGAFIADEASYILSNPIPGLEPLTLLGFSDLNHNNLRTFSTDDGETWTPAETISLEPNVASLHGGTSLQDVTIAQIYDGSYLLFYVTDIPKE